MNTPIRMSAIVLFNQQRVRDRQKREQLTEAFRKADKNGDGRLSVEEIHGIYTAHGVDVSREDVQKIVDAADKDGTGLLTEKEFVNSQAVGDVSLNFWRQKCHFELGNSNNILIVHFGYIWVYLGTFGYI